MNSIGRWRMQGAMPMNVDEDIRYLINDEHKVAVDTMTQLFDERR